jgi:hypothetical protein
MSELDACSPAVVLGVLFKYLVHVAEDCCTLSQFCRVPIKFYCHDLTNALGTLFSAILEEL